MAKGKIMRLLIASDLHGSLSSLRFIEKKLLALKPDLLVLLGDLVYHGPRNPLPPQYDTVSVLTEAPSLMDAPIMAVRGNCDAEVDVEQMPFPMPDNAWLDVDNLRIFATHGHRIPPNGPIPFMPDGAVVLRGHTHVPRGETINGLHFWNPGSLSLPKGGFPRSYGLYENGVFRVLDMEDREILRHQPA